MVSLLSWFQGASSRTNSTFGLPCRLICCILLCTVPTPSMAHSDAKLILAQHFGNFRARVLDFGSVFNQSWVHKAIIVTPPNDPRLCEYPVGPLHNNTNYNFTINRFIDNNSSDNATTAVDNRTIISNNGGGNDDENEADTSQSIDDIRRRPPNLALLVSLGGCSVLSKALIAAQVQTRIVPNLKYIIFYNDNPTNSQEILNSEATLNIHDQQPHSYDDLGFVFVSAKTGGDMLETILRVSQETGTSPYLLSPQNDEWNLGIRIEIAGIVPRWFSAIFYLLWLVPEFGLIGFWIYSRYKAGARIEYQRNEHGRVTGIRYIPPPDDNRNDNMFGRPFGARYRIPRHASRCRLTEAQVLALPEIAYRKTAADENDENSECENHSCIDVEVDGEHGTPKQVTNSQLCCDGTEEDSPEVNAVLSSAAGNSSDDGNTNCDDDGLNVESFGTTCSICIQDYESGELIRVLPRCKHTFHTPCIMQWLTERQGVCPLCKTLVLEESEDLSKRNDSTQVESSSSEDENALESTALDQQADEENPSQLTNH